MRVVSNGPALVLEIRTAGKSECKVQTGNRKGDGKTSSVIMKKITVLIIGLRW